MRLGMMLAVTVAAAMVAATTQASAAILEFDWSGTVYSGYDQSGVFGAANTSLNGEAYTAKYLFNDALGTRYSSGGQLSQDYGDYPNSPALLTSLTINGETVSFQGAYQGIISLAAFEDEVSTYSFADFVDGPYSASYLEQDMVDASVPGGLESNFSSGGEQGSLNQFQIAQAITANGPVGFADGVLSPSMVTERVVSAAPELSTWALMLVGLGGIGLAMRRRRSTTALA